MDKNTPQFIVWRPGYSVGDADLYSQHKEIFDIINGMYLQMRSGISNEEMNLRSAEVKSYAQKHFRREEYAMRTCRYPDLEAHQPAHREYAYKVQSLIRQQSQHADTLAYDLLSFLKTWWQGHVTEMDQRYAPLLKGPQQAEGPGASES